MSALSVGTNGSYMIVALAQQRVQGAAAQVQKDREQLRVDQARLETSQQEATAAQQEAGRIQQNQTQQGVQAGQDQLAQKAATAEGKTLQALPTVSTLPQLSQIDITAGLSPSQASAAGQSAPSQPTVNTSGQTVGTIINVVA